VPGLALVLLHRFALPEGARLRAAFGPAFDRLPSTAGPAAPADGPDGNGPAAEAAFRDVVSSSKRLEQFPCAVI
jgi:hypothetical protein